MFSQHTFLDQPLKPLFCLVFRNLQIIRHLGFGLGRFHLPYQLPHLGKQFIGWSQGRFDSQREGGASLTGNKYCGISYELGFS
jgi:hypothetical protein